jgi:hypothetical protein
VWAAIRSTNNLRFLMFRPTPRIVVVLGMVAALALPAGASATHSWGGYHWARTANPFTLNVSDNVSTAWDSILDTSTSDWSTPPAGYTKVVDLTKVTGSTNPRKCRATLGRVEVCDAAYGYNGWLGVAQIWITGGTHIVQGTVKVNDSYFNTATYNTTAWRNLVMCQEIGHTLGLDHQDTTFNNANLGTCMDYTNDPSTNQHPNNHDFEELAIIYSHLDLTTTIASSTRSAGAGTGARSDWGREVSTAHGGRTSVSVFVREDGNGQATITFVIWAR